jgi:lysine 2,3-aminomutase
MEQLHGYETGFSVPQYVYTTKLGKIPLNNQYFYKLGSKNFVLGYDHKTLEIP